MKQHLLKALLCLSSLLYIYSSSYAQTQYLKANSVEGFVLSSVETSSSCQDAKYSPLSTDNSQNIVLLNNPNQDCSNKTNVSFHLLNLHQTNWMRVTCMTFSEQTIGVYNIAPVTYLNRTVTLPYNANYLWKTEYVASQTPIFGNDTLRIEVNNFQANINTTDNNLNLPSGNVSYRIKAGQSYNLFTLQGTGPFTVISGAAQGTQNVIFEAYDNNIKIGEDVLTVIVGPVCNVTIDNFEPIAFGSMTYNLTLRSNISAKPYLWELRDAYGTGIVRKTGTTSANTTGNVEQISLAGIGTGTYKLFVRPINNIYCWGSRNVAITDDQNRCTVSILNPKVQSNLFTCTIAVSANLSGMAWSLQNTKDSLIASGTSFNPSVNLQNLPAGDYVLYAKPNNFCSATYRFSWNPIAPQNESRGYLKKYNNVPDYYEIAGIGDYGGVKDAGTGWVVRENRTVMLWQTYVKALSNSPGAKALITFRQDSSSTSKQFSLAFEKGKIKVITRSVKGGANVVSTEIATTSESTWLRFERNGNNLLCKISDSPPESDNPAFSTVSTINNAFAGWVLPFWKGLYVSSGSSTTLATAEFHRFLGGPYTGTSAIIDNTPLSAPIVTASNLNPTVNASVSLTSSACKSGYLIQFYKNGVPSYQGSPYIVTVAYGDSYKAKCEKGSDKSAFSNTIAFNAPANDQLCGITDGTKIGNKTQFSTVFELKARIFGGKLWLTQDLNTTPESFLVRGVNFTVGDFVKTWTGTDFSCFEGQTTGVGGLVEPPGFTTPAGYTLTVQPDQARIYSLGTPPNPEGGTTVATGIIFPNMFATITPETVNDTFGAEKFMNLTYPAGLVRGSFPKTLNNDLGLTLPNWINILHTDLSLVYKNKGYNVIDDFGYLGSVDIRAHGTQGVDWQLFPWGNFVTSLPIERRVETYLGTLVHDFLDLDDAGVIQKGFQIANNTDFGNIVANGKSQRAYTSVDSEGAGEDGAAGIHKPLLLFKTIFENTRGIVSYMYGQPIRSDLGYTTNGYGYPDANGNLPLSDINPLFRDSETINGVPYKLIDSKGLAPHGEISHYGETAYGNYNDGVRQLTVFGPNANNEHYLARVVEHSEKNYYAYKKLGGSDLVMFQNKMICDRGSNGWKYNDGTRQNGGTKAPFTGYLKRDQIFKSQMASFFSGVHTVEWNRPPAGLNTDPANGIEEARTILNTEVIFSPTERISALKLRTGAFEFSLWNAEYKLQGETNWRKEKGYQLKETQDNLLVRFMKKGNYMIVFVCDPYNLATKKNLSVRWGNFEKSYTTADWASCYSDGSTKDYIYAIYKISNITTDGGTATAPVIISNPTNPVAGSAVTFSTSSQCSGTIKWYNGDAQMASGVIYTVPNPVANDSYSATCTVGSNTSAGSNSITIANAPPASGSVTITEPTKPQYFFSNGQAPTHYNSLSNLPAIFTNTNTYDPVNDFVWLYNDKIKVALNLKRGGQIAWASLLNSTTNLVYNGYDGGFQIQLDAYQKPDGYSQNGKYSRSRFHAFGQYTNDPNLSDANGPIPLTSYNVTQGGDFNNHSQSLIDYHRVGTNGYYIKIRPIFYTFDNEMSRTYIEVTYTLDGYSVKCDYKYTSFRNDGQYPGNGTNGQYDSGFDSGHAPVCFLVNNLYKFKSYTGNSPWTRDNAGIEDGNLPNESSGQTPLTKNSKERWSLVYNPNTNATIGVYANSSDTENSFGLKQKEVNGTDRPGNEFGGGYTILGRNYDLVPFLTNFDRTNFNKNISSYVVVTPDPATFINEVYRISGH